MSPSNIIRIAAVLIPNEQDQILCVRKEGTEMFMFPGGKQELWETPAQAAIRELEEEDLDLYGRFQAPAANEPGFYVDCHVSSTFDVFLNYTPDVYEELAEAKYFSSKPRSKKLAPLTRDVFEAISSEVR
ncbi:NUDIX hydrolase [Corynebacterium glutamicum]|uniref:NUDIX hydrolase n=1 Tax=Corynebacterium glutamicum TaxID=1718 RepID=UPI001E550FFA|nr:NUDIX domain-containing protein [Corynebacterium glutamicum]